MREFLRKIRVHLFFTAAFIFTSLSYILDKLRLAPRAEKE